MAKCKDCDFWHKAEDHHIYGACHRMPPTPDFSFTIQPNKWGEGGSGTISRRADPIWPCTHEDDWCGEYK